MSEAERSIRDVLAGHIANHDRAAAVTAALQAVEAGSITVEALYDMLAEHLVEIGTSWRIGETEVWEEHYATAVVRTIVEACHPHVVARAAKPNGRVAVLATPPEEYHDLGLRMLADRLILAGWRVHLLGGNVPAAELVAAARELHADTAVVSVYTHYHRVALKAYVDEVRAALPALRLLVGGAAFAHEHDGWPDGLVLQPEGIASLDGRVG